MTTIDLQAEERTLLCQCCAETSAVHRDADVGPVCTDCFCLLICAGHWLKMVHRRWQRAKGDGAR